MIRKIAWVAFFMATSVSCLDEPDCYALNNNLISLSFKKPDNTADVIKFQGIETRNKDNVPVVGYVGDSVSTVVLPLDYFSDETAYVFRHSEWRPDTVFFSTDTVIFRYLSKVQFVSDSCGQRYVLSGLSVVEMEEESTFDSLRILSTTPYREGTSAKTTIEIRRTK
jgi:hypothetical protein